MIIDLKRSIDLRWLFDGVLSFILRWSCFCVLRRDRDLRKSFIIVEREKLKPTLTRNPGIENSCLTLVGTPVNDEKCLCVTKNGHFLKAQLGTPLNDKKCVFVSVSRKMITSFKGTKLRAIGAKRDVENAPKSYSGHFFGPEREPPTPPPYVRLYWFGHTLPHLQLRNLCRPP